MKKILNIVAAVMTILLTASCYEDFRQDYKFSSAYFASQKPYRTVIADRDMSVRVGISFGGRLHADPDDWGKFVLDNTLLEGTGLAALPEHYYSLSNNGMFTNRKPNLAIADVEIRFTEDFYSDPKSTGLYYALPFKLVESSCDSILAGKDISIVAIKYISTYHGAYYVQGKVTEYNTDGVTVSDTRSYDNADLSKNIVRNLGTKGRFILEKQGFADNAVDASNAKERMELVFDPIDKTVAVNPVEGCIEVFDTAGTFTDSGGRLTIDLSYSFIKDGKKFKVEERLTRRQDPLNDLVFEKWS